MINVRSKKCKLCNRVAYYNIKGEKALFCKDHRKDGMINAINIRCSLCNKLAYYNIEGKKALFCKEHKKDEMINVVRKKRKISDDTYNEGKKRKISDDTYNENEISDVKISFNIEAVNALLHLNH